MKDDLLERIKRIAKPIATVRTLDSREARIKVGPGSYRKSVTVYSLDQFEEQCDQIAGTIRRNCVLIFRGQTREYTLADDTISLLPSNWRQSTNLFLTRIGPPDSTVPFRQEFQEFLKFLNLRERADAGFFKTLPKDLQQVHYTMLYFHGLLQHYGFPTGHSDVTADRHVALWFAFHQRQKVQRVAPGVDVDMVTYDLSPEQFGVIYAMEVPSPRLGMKRKVVPNVMCLDLRSEILSKKWRPWRQSALSLTQDQWGTIPGKNFNVFATCVKARILVSRNVAKAVQEKYPTEWNMRWLFPTYMEDQIYQHVLQREPVLNRDPLFREQYIWRPEWLILPEYLWHFKWCYKHSSRLECFKNQ